MSTPDEIRADLLSILGYSCETQAPNAKPTTEFVTDRWMRPRLDALVAYVLSAAAVSAPACVIVGSPARCTTHDVLATCWETADDGPTASATEPTCPLAGDLVDEPDEVRRPWSRALEDEASVTE